MTCPACAKHPAPHSQPGDVQRTIDAARGNLRYGMTWEREPAEQPKPTIGSGAGDRLARFTPAPPSPAAVGGLGKAFAALTRKNPS